MYVASGQAQARPAASSRVVLYRVGPVLDSAHGGSTYSEGPGGRAHRPAVLQEVSDGLHLLWRQRRGPAPGVRPSRRRGPRRRRGVNGQQERGAAARGRPGTGAFRPLGRSRPRPRTGHRDWGCQAGVGQRPWASLGLNHLPQQMAQPPPQRSSSASSSLTRASAESARASRSSSKVMR